LTKIEREMKKRERDAIRAVNKAEGDLHEIYEDALKVLFDLALVLVGIVLGMYLSATRTQAAETVSIPPRAEYVGPITEAAPEALPEAANEAVATMPDAIMVEPVGTHWERLGRWKTTGYCPCRRCNGRNAGKTASGAPMIPGRTVAVGGLPFGTVLKVGNTEYVVEDRGTPYGHIDFLYPDHKTASRHGVQYLEVYIKRGER
jgi:3D (Asp-Asp-Asp) domain-containing protein